MDAAARTAEGGMIMICPECNGRGEAIYYVETDRDENTVTVEQRKGICRTCNGSGEKQQTKADCIRAMSDEDLEDFLFAEEWMCDTYNSCSVCPLRGEKGCISILEWLKQPVEDEQ